MRIATTLMALTLFACSGPEERADDPAPEEPVTEAPVTETPVEDPASDDAIAGPVCAADADCELVTECCACPPIPQAMTHAEAEVVRERCTRVRCAACGEPVPPGERVAACVERRCVAR